MEYPNLDYVGDLIYQSTTKPVAVIIDICQYALPTT